MARLYTYTCIDMTVYIKNINEQWFFFPIHMAVFSHFLNGNNTSRTLSLFPSLSFIFFYISKVYIMLSPTSQSSPALHYFFNKEKTSAETTTKLDIISSIWDDDHK